MSGTLARLAAALRTSRVGVAGGGNTGRVVGGGNVSGRGDEATGRACAVGLDALGRGGAMEGEGRDGGTGGASTNDAAIGADRGLVTGVESVGGRGSASDVGDGGVSMIGAATGAG